MKKIFVLAGVLALCACDRMPEYEANKTAFCETDETIVCDENSGEMKFLSCKLGQNICRDKEGNMLTGRMRLFYDNGQTRLDFIYRNGKLDGPTKMYAENGELLTTVEFKDGVPNGSMKMYHKNGRVKVDTPFRNGLRDGLEKHYYENGRLMANTVWKNDAYNGENISYYENGKKESVLKYVDGVRNGVSRTYYKDGGLMSEAAFVNDKQEGITKTYHPNGNIASESNMHDNMRNGTYKTFYENGELETEYNMVNDKREGLAKLYEQDGKVAQEMNFKNDKADGLATSYDTLYNRIYFTENYVDGKLMEKTKYFYDSKNELLYVVTYRGETDEIIKIVFRDKEISKAEFDAKLKEIKYQECIAKINFCGDNETIGCYKKISGRVSSITNNGVLLDTSGLLGIFSSDPSYVFLYTTREYVSDEKVGGRYYVKYAGTYEYENILGSKRRVRAYRETDTEICRK